MKNEQCGTQGEIVSLREAMTRLVVRQNTDEAELRARAAALLPLDTLAKALAGNRDWLQCEMNRAMGNAPSGIKVRRPRVLTSLGKNIALAEEFIQARNAIEQSLIEKARKVFSFVDVDAPDLVQRKAMLTWSILKEFDLNTTGNDDELLAQRLLLSGYVNGRVQLFTFTCPIIDAAYLVGPDPSYYISTSAKGNNFETNRKRTKAMLDACRSLDIDCDLNVIIADNDEPDYMFPILSMPAGYDKDIVESRKKEYEEDFIRRTREAKVDCRVLRWSKDIEPMAQDRLLAQENSLLQSIQLNPNSLFDSFSLDQEARKFRDEVFCPGGYYGGFPVPEYNKLQAIVAYKFATYARQGLLLRKLFPYGVLLQNETPSVLRTEMLNGAVGALYGGESQIPALYPYTFI